ncbi:MAG: malectin domain-containing carbohydrate-binding protein, partial [Cyanobacteria bacterium J06633_2]
NKTPGFNVQPGVTVSSTTPAAIFQSERWDGLGDPRMKWAFDVPSAGLYEVRLFMGNGFDGTSAAGERVFDVKLEGSVPSTLDNIDLSGQFGHLIGGMISNTVEVTDGTLNIEFVNGIENPLVNGIEIIALDATNPPTTPLVSILGGSQTVDESGGQVQIAIATDVTVPSNETVDVTFEIVPGTATPGANGDYTYASNSNTFNAETGVYTDTVTIAGGSSDAAVFVDILQDSIDESNETFSVNITNVSSNAQIGTASTSITIEDDDTDTNPPSDSSVLYRVNAGGNQVAAIDGGPAWTADTASNNSPYLTEDGTNKTPGFNVQPGVTVSSTTPAAIFQS